MGDMADAIINGDFDEYTGEYIGPGQGFPRSRYHNRTRNEKPHATDINTCMNFLRTRGYVTNDARFDALRSYGPSINKSTPSSIAKHVRQSKPEWNLFKKFIDTLKTSTNEG